MSRKKKTLYPKEHGPFLMLRLCLLRSAEFKRLTPAQRLICQEIYATASEQTRQGPVRAGMVAEESYLQIKENTGFGSATTSKALKVLERAGFIERKSREERLQLRVGNLDACGEYTISDKWKNGNN